MGTSNFYYRNASKVFAIGLNYEQPILDEDGNETDENENVSCESFEYEEQIENVKYHMEENKGKFHFSDYEQKSQLDNRNFCASYVGSLSANKNFGDVNIDVQINAFSRAGYYEGACLDWELCVNVDGNGNDSDDIEDVTYFVENTSSRNMNDGMLKIQAKNAQKWANKISDELIAAVEKSFEISSTCFVRVATFSNGETIYQKCE
jgi:hypothetical protein